MSVQHKTEFPPLLSAGFHPHTMEQLKKLCIEPYKFSQRRPEIMAGLESIHGRLSGLEITGEMWVDGSFLTQKPEPEDVDVVVYTPSVFFDKGTPQQQDFLNWLSDDKETVRNLFSCHSAAIASYSVGHIMHPLYIATRRGYEDAFGHSFATRELKGIAVITLSPIVRGKAGA